MGLDLIMRAAEHAGEQSDSSASVADVMSAVRTQLPIGTRIHMELEREQSGAMRILRNEVSHAPFQRPVEQRSDRERGEDTSSGFDSEWDPRGANVEAELSEEEVALQVVDPRETESNGRPIRESDQSRAVNDSIGPLEPLASLPTLYAQAAWESEPLSPETWGRIVGYEVIDASNIALVIEPLDVRAPVDPGDHPDLAYGQEIEVRVCGVVKNTESGFVQIARMDGLGYFYLRVPPWNELKPGERGDLNGTTIGLINTDGDCLSRLMPGSVFTGVVITNETDGVTITLLPALYADLAHTTSEILPVDGTPTAFYAARIIEAANPWGKVRIELEYGQPKKGLSHQFEIEKQLLGRARISQQEIGCQLLVALNRDRGRSRNTLKIDGQNRKLITFVKACGDNLRLNGDKIEMGDGDLSLAVIQGLQACDSSSQWRNGVWEFYTASLRYSVGAIRPQITRTYVTCSPHIVSLLQQRRLDIQDRYEAVMRPTEAAGTIEIASPQAAAAEEGARGLKELSDLPRIIAILPPNTAGLVLGKEHVHRKVLETRPGIHWVWVDNDTLGIIGEIDQAVERALEVVRTMVEGTTGELIVPAGKNGLLIGRNGATIQRLKDSTGCQARNLNRGEKWIVDGPTEAAVRAFFQMANQIVGGTGKIVNSRKLRIIENTTKGASARPQRASQVVGRNMESSYSPPTGVPSTPRTTERKDASRCFIATACYGTSTHPDVILLRRWRDTNLLRSFTGQLFVRLYYCFSPTVAKFLTKRKTIARIVRVLVLQRMVRHLRPRL
jgi:hypothetical protein